MKIPVRIAEIQDISPTVKSFVLDLQGQAFSFLAGQWIDCFVEIDGRTGGRGILDYIVAERDWVVFDCGEAGGR